MTKPVIEDLKERRERIMIIAEEVFAEHTFEGASIRLITQRSGINSSMIGYYFGSKEALYLHIFRLRLEEIAKEIDRFEKLDLNPAEKLKAYLTAYIKRVADNKDFYRLLCNELVTPQHATVIPLVSEARQLVHDFLVKSIEQGIRQGYFKKIDEEVFALNILALVWSAYADHMTTRIHLNKPIAEDIPKRILDYILTMLSLEDHKQF